MFKRLAKKFFGAGPRGQSQDGFFLDVRCSACGEVFHLFVHSATDLVQNLDEAGGVTYSLKKEIVGAACRNLIRVRMEFDGSKNLVAREIENGEFLEEVEN
jgi:hypothetical protein